MSLSAGIVGLPNVGKSTLFNALTKGQVLAANYPFATIDPNIGIVELPDPRLVRLSELYGSAKTVPAPVTFVDIAGLVAGASSGQGLGNQFLSHIRECAAIVQVVRVFSDANVTHVEGRIDPKSDIETIQTELILADLQTLEKWTTKQHNPAAESAMKILNAGETLTSAGFDIEQLAELQLLTTKPFIFVFNLDEQDLNNDLMQKELSDLVMPTQAIFLCAKIEADLAELPQQESKELLSELGQESSGLEQLAKAAFDTLGLQTFLTAGPYEVRAWTIQKGATAPEAAGVIHTDFQKGFIKAEVVNFQDLVGAGSKVAAKAQGKVRLEGRDYQMQDGDVVEFRFNL